LHAKKEKDLKNFRDRFIKIFNFFSPFTPLLSLPSFLHSRTSSFAFKMGGKSQKTPSNEKEKAGEPDLFFQSKVFSREFSPLRLMAEN